MVTSEKAWFVAGGRARSIKTTYRREIMEAGTVA
jgi:hypothetical protein